MIRSSLRSPGPPRAARPRPRFSTVVLASFPANIAAFHDSGSHVRAQAIRRERERAEKSASFFQRLRKKINRGPILSYDLANLLPNRRIDAALLEEIETRLLRATSASTRPRRS